MKRHFSILMIVAMAFAQTPFQEILRVPLLFTHYRQHKSTELSLSWGRFLNEHYNSKSHTDSDTEKDNQLPFAGSELHLIASMFGCTGPACFEYQFPTSPARTLEHQLLARLLSPSLHRIFQPPKP